MTFTELWLSCDWHFRFNVTYNFNFLICFPIKEWMSFFSAFTGKWTWVKHVMNPVNREAVLGRFVTASPKFISHERRKIRHSFLIFTISSNKKYYSESPRQKKKKLKIDWQWPHFNEYKMSILLTYFVVFWRNHMTSQWRRSGFAR